jgi:hypothetical protein
MSETKNENADILMKRIWELRMYMYLWRFMFGNESSEEKLKEFANYFTDKVLGIFQESLQTKILVELKTLIDKRKNVVSIYSISDDISVKELNKYYSEIRKFTNNCVTHKARNIDNFSYKFQDVWLTVEELQKLINELDSNKEIIWNSENLVKEDFEYLYEKVKEYSVVQSKLVNKS